MCDCCMQFVKELLHIVDSQDKTRHELGLDMSRDRSDHEVWCEKTWQHVIPTLEYWALELRQLKVFYISFISF